MVLSEKPSVSEKIAMVAFIEAESSNMPNFVEELRTLKQSGNFQSLLQRKEEREYAIRTFTYNMGNALRSIDNEARQTFIYYLMCALVGGVSASAYDNIPDRQIYFRALSNDRLMNSLTSAF